MDLILVRHAKEEETNLIKFPEDDKRPLCQKGKTVQKKVSQALKKIVEEVALIWTGTCQYMIETAEIIAFQLKIMDKIEQVPLLGSSFDINSFDRVLRERSMTEERILIVVNEQQLMEMAKHYLGIELRMKIKKSGVLLITFAENPLVGEGFLRGLYQPKDLLRLLA